MLLIQISAPPVKIILTNFTDMGHERIEDTRIVEMDLNQQSTISLLKEEFHSLLDMNITEKDQIYWKDPSPTENFVKIVNDESLQLALRVREHIRDFFLTFKVQKIQI